MTLKSVFTDDKGKYANATYECVVQGMFVDNLIPHLYPKQYGKSVVAFGWRYANNETRWFMMVCNGKQTTRADIVTRLKEVVPIEKISVQVVAAIPETSSAVRIGSPRQGTTRALPNAPHGKVVIAH